jgi:NADP+-dependent farnesol dehydrogenase
MEQWKGKIAVVTGASAGIGAVTVLDLVKAGMIVVGLARRADRITALKTQLPVELRENLHAMKCDVSKEAEIVAVFAAIEKLLGGIDVLINNAGILHRADLTEPGNSDIVTSVVNTNVLGPVFCTREAVQSMMKRERHGHIIHINSVVGHKIGVSTASKSLNIYAPSKYAVTAMTEVMRQEFVKNKTTIKITVSCISYLFENCLKYSWHFFLLIVRA